MSSKRQRILSSRQQFCQGDYAKFLADSDISMMKDWNAHGKTKAINPNLRVRSNIKLKMASSHVRNWDDAVFVFMNKNDIMDIFIF
jgi:hypothetical protein